MFAICYPTAVASLMSTVFSHSMLQFAIVTVLPIAIVICRLPEKISADRDGLLVLMAYTEVGLLNNVMELWRYPSAAACIK